LVCTAVAIIPAYIIFFLLLSHRAAAYVSYPISFLLREAQKGNFKNSQDFCRKLNLIHDGDLSTALNVIDIMHLVRDNQDYIAQHADSNLEDDFGWLRVFERFKHMAGNEDPENLSLLEFDDHHDSYRLAYGIAINKYVFPMSLIPGSNNRSILTR
jgi:hypothetical protein